MKSLKKIALSLAVTMFLTSMVAGCGNTKDSTSTDTAAPSTVATTESTQAAPTGPDISKEVKLKMYLLGDKSKDFDAVFGEINKLAKAEINATVDVGMMGWGDYEQKYPLVFASGEDFDLVYTADWAFYNTQATKGGFLELTDDLLKQFAPKTAETMYPDAMKQAKVNDKLYMLPMNYKEITGYVYLVRGDLMKKYGIEDIKTLDDYTKYLDAIAKNEKQLIPLDIGSDFDMAFMFDRLWKELSEIDGVGPWQLSAWTAKGDDTAAIKHHVEHPKFVEIVTKLKDMKDKGYWSKSAIVNKNTNKDSFLSGKGASAMLNLNDAKGQYNSITNAHPEWDIRVFDALGQAAPTLTSYMGNGMGVFAQSKNPERALMLLDLLRNDERYHDLFSFGIKGKHYDLTADNKVKLLEATADYPMDGNCNWGIRNDKFWKITEGGLPNYQELHDKWAAVAAPTPLQYFNFNDQNVKNEVATINNIFKTDYKALVLGFTKDPAADVAKLQAKLKTAGAEKVYAEMQKQAVEYLKANK